MDIPVAVGTGFVLLEPLPETRIMEPVFTLTVQRHSLSVVEGLPTHLALAVSLEDAGVRTSLYPLVIEFRRKLFVVVETQ